MESTCQVYHNITQQAVAYHDLGFTVLPANGKKCSLQNWSKYQTQRPTREQVIDWFRAGNKNALLMCGGEKRLFVRDFDSKEGYHAWADAHSSVAEELPTVETKNGFHVYAAITEEHEAEVRSEFGNIGNGAIDLGRPDGELRMGPGALVIAPPSTHPDPNETGLSVKYKWISDFDGSLSEISIYDLELHLNWHPFTQTLRQPDTHDTHDNHDAQDVSLDQILEKSDRVSFDGVEADIVPIIEATQPTGSGQRNAKLFELARCLKFHPALAGATPKAAEAVRSEVVRDGTAQH